jgi:hypothetical protein
MPSVAILILEAAPARTRVVGCDVAHSHSITGIGKCRITVGNSGLWKMPIRDKAVLVDLQVPDRTGFEVISV